MKGLLKGLRCISDFFDNEKEPEMQIGLPTDVKHVAHIGWDGPSTTAPSWMKEFSTTPSSGSQNVGSRATSGHDAEVDSPTRRGKTKKSRRQAAGAGGASSSSPVIKDSLRISKPKKNKNSNSDSPTKESSRARQIKNSILASDSSSGELSVIKNRKKKGMVGERSARPSRSRNQDSSTTQPTPN